jgi:hypothetical protein
MVVFVVVRAEAFELVAERVVVRIKMNHGIT